MAQPEDTPEINEPEVEADEHRTAVDIPIVSPLGFELNYPDAPSMLEHVRPDDN